MSEFDMMFDEIDLNRKGYINADQLHAFCEALYFSPICVQHVEGAVELVCGSSGMVTSQEFLTVLTDIERRRGTEEQAYWNFQALDYTGSSRISLHDTLLLFKEIHGEKFSLGTWKRFLSTREFPGSDVYFDEIRFWLCSPPFGTPCSDRELKEEEKKIFMRQANFAYDEFNSIKSHLDDDYSSQKEKEEHEEDTLRHAQRKLKKWNKQGVEAMLFDDGLDLDDSQIKVKSKNQITMGDLNELLEQKYENLKKELIMLMAKQASAVDDELPEVLQQLQRQSKQLIKDGAKYSGVLPSGQVQMPASLTGLMGELRLDDREHRQQMEEMKLRLRNEGRSLREIALAVQEQYEQIIAGDASCAGLLMQIHKRHRQERETMVSLLNMDSKPLSEAMIIEYGRLMRQLLVMDEEKAFVPMATILGLAEREMEPKLDRSDWDRSRSERLAQLRLLERHGAKQVRTSHELPHEESLKSAAPIDLQVIVVKEMTKKHFYEREAIIHMLLSKEGQKLYDQSRKLKSDDRKHQLKGLQNHHQMWKSNPRADKSALHNILSEALWLKHEERRCELEVSGGPANISSEEMREILLADLQQRQGVDFETVLQEMQAMQRDELLVVLKKECRTRVDEHYDNLAFVVLGTLDISQEDEEYIEALEHKYDVMRKRIFLMALKEQLDWRDLSKEDKQSAIRDVMKHEKLQRSECKFTEMEQHVGPKAKILPALRSLMGEDKAECLRRKKQQKDDEDPVNQSQVINVLADLVPRYDNEQEFLLAWLHSPEAKSLSLRMRRMRIVEMKVETFRVEMEEEFEIAALSEGLMERVMDTLTHRHESDRDRQSQLARKRVQIRGRRIQEEEKYRKEPEIRRDKIPLKGDLTGLQTVYLREMLKRHADEREIILNDLQDESIDDLIEAASTMSETERQQRLAELQGKRQNLNLTIPDDKEEHVSILEEAAALRAVSTKQQLVQYGETANITAVAVVLLAELQDEQDREVALTLSQIENMNEEDIRTCLDREINNRRLGTAWNVINVFTRYQGEATDDLLLKGLEKKYNVLRERLLVDSLRIRVGTDQWEEFSQKERQQKLNALDAQAKEQLRLGQILPSLLGEEFHLPETVFQMMGVCPHVFKNKVKGQVVTGNLSNLRMNEDTGALSKKGEPGNLLKDLYTRFEEEKHALVRQLKGLAEDYFNEKERQVQLVGYHRESMLANQKGTFFTMATWVGLVERQQEEAKFRLQMDKQRYEKVAAKVILEIQKGKPQAELVPGSAPSGTLIDLLDAVMVHLENKHMQERQLFHRLLESTDKYSDMQQQAAMCTQQQRLEKMSELKEARKISVLDRNMENLECLTEATVYKKEDRRSHRNTEAGDITEDDLCTSLMADLLEYQNCEAERILHLLAQNSEGEILQYQNKILKDKKSNMADNIALVVLCPEKTDGTTEDDLIEALKGKYDALKDKLLAEALMKELGESEWNRLSEKERQKKIFELKLKEKQLRKAGKVDEANALLAELLKDQENLRQLMGDSEEEQRQKLQERLRRRRERLSQGMSEEEVNELEKEEIEREEEEDRNKKRNILDDLEHRFEQERDELLRRLNNADDEFERERERQANLARLRRDERLARKEGNFGSAALILGLAEKHDKDLRLSREEERERQEKLARERLEAARVRRRKGVKDGDKEDETHVVDKEDPASLQEDIARDMDRRHRHEREFFMKLLEENIEGDHRKAAQGMTADERDDKIFELGEMYKNWLKSDDKNTQEQTEFLGEIAGCKLEIMSVQAQADGRQVTSDDLQVALLANLQEHQKQEAQHLLTDIENKELLGLQQLHKAISLLNKDGCHNNIASVLLGDILPRESTEDDEEEESAEASVIKALEHKYDAIKEKLLMEALMKEHGESEWAAMSEKQRQKKLIELKLKERQLRKAGKLDEIANIIGSHLENEKLLDELIGESKKSQKQKLQERLARKKELIAEREAEGLSTDDTTVDAIIEEEEVQEEKLKRRNILENLERDFEDEKLRLLRTLSNQMDKVSMERQRQLEIAKIKRDERLMQKSQKLETVATIIFNSKENDKRREQGIEAERERQRLAAQERLEARRRKKHGTPLNTDEMEKKLLEEEEKAALEDAVKQAEGQSIQEALMTTVENKQEEEMDMLMALMDIARADKQQAKKFNSEQDSELKSELTRLEQEQMRWRKHSAQMASELDEANMTVEKSQQHMADVAKNRSDQIKILAEALVCRLEVEKRLLQQKKSDMSADRMEEELQVAMMTDLQEKQISENRAMQKLMEEQDEKMLREMKKSQHVACREGWFDNLSRTIFHVSLMKGGTDEKESIEEKFQETLAQMEADFEAGKEKEIEKARQNAAAEGEVIDDEAVKEKLMQEYEDKKQAVMDDMHKQKEVMMQKLAVKRMSREQKDYEELSVRHMLKLVEDQMNNVKENIEQERGKQSNLLQQRLAERKEARKAAKIFMEREDTLDGFDDGTSGKSPASRKDATPSPFGAMHREKTVVDVDVSEEQKQAMITSIMRQQKNLQSKITEQQKRQEEMLKRRLRARHGKQEEEAAELFSLGERQKTTLEASKRDEKERQLQKMKEKVSRLRDKREPSPAGKLAPITED